MPEDAGAGHSEEKDLSVFSDYVTEFEQADTDFAKHLKENNRLDHREVEKHLWGLRHVLRSLSGQWKGLSRDSLRIAPDAPQKARRYSASYKLYKALDRYFRSPDEIDPLNKRGEVDKSKKMEVSKKKDDFLNNICDALTQMGFNGEGAREVLSASGDFGSSDELAKPK